MPYKDGTGPEGKGSKTGLGLGNCDSESKNYNTMNDVEMRTLLERIFDLFGRVGGQGIGKGRRMGRGQGLGQGLGMKQGQRMGRGQGWGRNRND